MTHAQKIREIRARGRIRAGSTGSADGVAIDDRGAGLEPPRRMVWISRAQAAGLQEARELALRLDAEMLAARGRSGSSWRLPLHSEGDWIEFAGRFFGFWGGALRVDSAEKSAFYAALGALPAQIFSIIFSCSLQFEVLPPLGE